MRLLILLLLLLIPAFAQTDTKPLALKLAASNEGFWKSTLEPKGSVTSRGIFAYVLVLCESQQNLERLEGLFDLAAKMQDRTEGSKSYGNFKWKWDDEKIVDYNAVDFSMRGGSLLWLKHQDEIPAPAREKLHELLQFSIEGLLRHKVAESYTNIALMNAGDLILLGEAMNRPDVATQGYKRLERVLLYTHQFGTHEYVSPTYYGPDLDALVMIEAFAKNPRGVEQSRALLKYFWTDIALNWFAPAARLSGANSRSYDYLSGLGELDKHLQLNGWLEGEPRDIDSIFSIQARWHPSDDLKQLNAQYPRYVQQKWGVENNQWRTNYIQDDVALSTAGASYGGRMDFPLTVDFPGPRKSVRCYFTSDARQDPYGQIKIAESATHSKALHLNPTWQAAQDNGVAAGIVTYQAKDIPPDAEKVESHFVMPFDNDGIWIKDRKITFEKGIPASYPLGFSDYVVLRKGTAALRVNVSYESGFKTFDAPINLVYDGNKFGAIRLTVTHFEGGKFGEAKDLRKSCSAVFEVLVGSNLYDARFKVFRTGLLNKILVSRWKNGEFDFLFAEEQIKAAQRANLALNNKEIGREILENVEPLQSAMNLGNLPVVDIHTIGNVHFEAESAQIMPAFEIGEDATASGGKFVWMPGEAGQGGGSALGSLTWTLNNETAGDYYLWGLVKAATPDDDSFFVHTFRGQDSVLSTVLPVTTWSIGTHDKWEWVRFPEKIGLLAGETNLQLRVREDGAQIDRLYLAHIPTDAPE